MSKELGWAVLQPDYRGARIPVMEHLWGLSRAAIIHFTGLDPVAEPSRINEAFRTLCEVFEVDLLWGGGLPDDKREVFDWEDGEKSKVNAAGGKVVQWGIFGTGHQEDGRHFLHVPKPKDVDEALAFEPLKYFPETVEEYQARFTAQHRAMLASCGDVCHPIPHHYTTSFHWPLAIFGFELLCEAGLQETEFAALMERFAVITDRITTAWSRVEGLKAFILHDDLTMAGGPVFAPAWYRRHIFKHYPSAFAPFLEKNIPVIFTSDGNCTAFVDDIFSFGASGLNFEYLVDLETLVEKYPDKILIGNINSATIANGPQQAIEAEVRRCLEIGKRAPRFVLNIGGQLTHNMPLENLEFYLNLRRQLCAAR